MQSSIILNSSKKFPGKTFTSGHHPWRHMRKRTTNTYSVIRYSSSGNISTTIPTPTTGFVGASNININKTKFNTNKNNFKVNVKVHTKNVEVVHLIQSLQTLLDIQKANNFHQHYTTTNNNKNFTSTPIIETTIDTTPTPTTTDQEIHSNHTISINVNNCKNNSNENNNNSNFMKMATKKWHENLNKAISNREKELAIQLFYKIPPLQSFLNHPFYLHHSIRLTTNNITDNNINNNHSSTIKTSQRSLNVNSYMNGISFLFKTLQNLMLLVTHERIDVAFHVFYKCEELYHIYEQELLHQYQQLQQREQQQQEQQEDYEQQKMVLQQSIDKLHHLREQILFKICFAFQYVKKYNDSKQQQQQQQQPQQQQIKLKASLSSATDVFQTNDTSSPPITRTQFTDMVQELISVIQYDINHDIYPTFQHKLYPKLMKSLLRQSFSDTTCLKETEALLWDIALSSLKEELEKLQQQHEQGGGRLSSIDNIDKIDINDNNMKMIGDENNVMDLLENYDCDEYDNDENTFYEEETTVYNKYEHRNNQSDQQKKECLITPEWMNILKEYESVLMLSSFRRQEQLPFVDILDIVVKHGGRPRSDIVMNILKNEYPYTNKNNVCALLESIIHLQKNQNKAEYLISPQNIEDITCAATKKGQSNTVLLIWDYLNLIRSRLQENNEPHSVLYSKPSPGLYENAAAVFAAASHQDHLVFGILSEMEKEGISPSRPLIKRLAASMRTRSTVKRLEKALHIIQASYNNHENYNVESSSMIPTTSALNTVLAAFADFGFSAKAMEIYHSFESLGCTPDENTYCFLMDSIEMDVTTAIPPTVPGHRRRYQGTIEDENMKSWLKTQVEAADAIFETAIESGYRSNEYMINSYVRILCATGELDRAMYLLDEMICNGEKVSQESLGFVALSNADIGDFEFVDNIISMSIQAGYRNGLSKHVLERIEKLRSKNLM